MGFERDTGRETKHLGIIGHSDVYTAKHIAQSMLLHNCVCVCVIVFNVQMLQ